MQKNFTAFRYLCLLLLAGLFHAARAQRIAAGNHHNLSLHADGTLWAWGLNTQGQLGNGQPFYTPAPLLIVAGSPLAARPSQAAPELWAVPNPARGQVRVAGAGPATQLRLFDGQGRLVRTATGASLSLAAVAPGLYLLQAAGDVAQPARTTRLVVE